MIWQVLIIAAVFLIAVAFIGRYVINKFRNDKCQGCAMAPPDPESEAVKQFRERVS